MRLLERRLVKLELRLLPRGLRGLKLIQLRIDAILSPRERVLLAEAEAWTKDGRESQLTADHHAAVEKNDEVFFSVFDGLRIFERPTLAEFDAVMAECEQ